MTDKIYNLPLLLSIALAIMLVCGCKNEEEKWQETKKSNNAVDYLNFVLKYPEGTHATEARSYLVDTISKMHIEAMDVYQDDQYSQKQHKKMALKIYNRILQIDPNDAHALNNAAVLRWMSYSDDPGKNKLQQIKDLLDQSFENANRRRISNTSSAWISNGGAVYLALPPPDKYKRVPLIDLVYKNLSAINYLLDIPRKRPVSPPELIISGIVVDTNDLPVAGRRLWLIGIDGDVDFNNIQTIFIVNNKGICINPYTDTDEKGRFSFRVAYDDGILDNLPANFFFITSTSLSRNIHLSKSSPTLSQNGKTLSIHVDENANVVNIGKACLRGE